MHEIVEPLGLAAGGLISLGVIGKACVWGFRRALGGVRFSDRVLKAVDLVEQELSPNSGGSLKDAVNRLDRRVLRLERHYELPDIEDVNPGGH